MNPFPFIIHSSFSLWMFLFLTLFFFFYPTLKLFTASSFLSFADYPNAYSPLSRLSPTLLLASLLPFSPSASNSSHIQGGEHLQPGHHHWHPFPYFPGWRGRSQAVSPSGGGSGGQLQLPPREHPPSQPHRTGMDWFEVYIDLMICVALFCPKTINNQLERTKYCTYQLPSHFIYFKLQKIYKTWL